MTKSFHNPLLYFILTIIFCFASNNFVVVAQEEEDDDVPAKLKYMRDKYEEFYTASFEKVWTATKSWLEATECRVLNERERLNDLGFQRGILQSELCVMSQQKDSAFKFIQKYSYKAPFIRGGVWTSFRVQYRFTVDDLGDGRISVWQRHELNGWENHVSFKAHEMTTNGLLEFEIFEQLKELIFR